MIKHIAASLRAWHPSGDPISAHEFVAALSIDASRLTLVGSGQKWEAARIVGFEQSLDSHKDMDEPYEAYAKAVQDAFVEFGKWLGKIPLQNLNSLRSMGTNIELFVGFWIDQDQFELGLPTELVSELGRLQLSVKMISND
jgi:hypothetical protein